MPYKKGSLKGQLTTAEIRKLISGHNKLSKITIPPRSTRDDIMKIISDAGFRVNHEQQKLEQIRATKKDISLDQAKDITKRVPKPKKQVKKEKEEKVLAIEDKKKGKVKEAVEKIEKKEKKEKTFKVERTERTQMINQLSSEMGKKFNPFKILGITAREETPELVKQKCRELRLKNHPDKGGDKEKFDMIQKACDVLLKTQTILKKSGNDKDKGEALKKPDEQDKSREGWKKYFKIVEDNKELLMSNKRSSGNPFKDSYDFYKTNQDVISGKSNLEMNYDKWIKIVEKKIKELKEKKPVEKEEKKDEGKEKEVRDLWKKILFPELRTEKDPKKLKKLFNKAVNIFADYKVNVLKTGVSKQTEAKRIKRVGGGSNLISKFIKGDKVNKVSIMGVDITDLYN